VFHRLAILVMIVVSTAAGNLPVAVQAADDPRYFPQTRHRIDDDRFWDFFQRRGGVRTFGYPVSGTFTLLNQEVQIFQRQVLQLQPNGGVGTLNLLDDGLMPYTKINGSTFPAPDPALLKSAPDVSDRDYHAKALQFVKEQAPEVWQGQPVKFFSTFSSTVRAEDAFPDGKVNENLLQGFNLEIWGLPTSKPTADPSNGGFIYQRFQRGILHYDWSCQCTQGLLLGQYFRGLILQRDLPGDLQAQAKDSRFFGQYRAARDGRPERPKDLPGTDFSSAFSRDPVVVLDAGHGGKEIGSSHTFADGLVLREKDLTLKVTQRLAKLLEGGTLEIVQTRTSDRALNEPPRDLTGDEKITLADELQARVDLANSAGADLLLSVHFNGVSKPEVRGTQVFFDDDRPFLERSKALAELVNTNLVRALADAGYQTVDRKATASDKILGGDSHYYLLGPATDIIKRPSNMPAVIAEALYLTNAEDANALRQDKILDALARGYAEAVKQYFQKYPT
jgi:N-acetylmuramoyl-L-alanine amidase